MGERDKCVGSSEGNLEKIFRLIHALGRCYVFIDEADQSLGRRDAAGGDSGIGGRIYSLLAEEMGSAFVDTDSHNLLGTDAWVLDPLVHLTDSAIVQESDGRRLGPREV